MEYWRSSNPADKPVNEILEQTLTLSSKSLELLMAQEAHLASVEDIVKIKKAFGSRVALKNPNEAATELNDDRIVTIQKIGVRPQQMLLEPVSNEFDTNSLAHLAIARQRKAFEQVKDL